MLRYRIQEWRAVLVLALAPTLVCPTPAVSTVDTIHTINTDVPIISDNHKDGGPKSRFFGSWELSHQRRDRQPERVYSDLPDTLVIGKSSAKIH